MPAAAQFGRAAANSGLFRTANVPTPTAFALSWWFRMVTDRGASKATFFKVSNGGSNSRGWDCSITSQKMGLGTVLGNNNISGATTIAVGRWYHAFAIFIGGTSYTLWLDGVQEVTEAVTGAGETPLTEIRFGTTASGTPFFRGDLAAIKEWDRSDFSLADIAAERFQVAPASRRGLRSAYLMPSSQDLFALHERGGRFAGAVSRWGDWSGRTGNELTEVGAIDTDVGPPIPWTAARADRITRWKAAGALFTQSLAGAITPAGALANRTGKALAGGMTPSGTLANRTNRILTAAMTPAGVLLKQTNKPLAGSMASSGTVSAIVVHLLTLGGTLTSGGTLKGRANKALAAAITPIGGLTKLTSRTLTAGITPSGTLAKQSNKVLGGVLASAGGLSRLIGRLLAGLLGSSGALSSSKNPGGAPIEVRFTLIRAGSLRLQTARVDATRWTAVRAGAQRFLSRQE